MMKPWRSPATANAAISAIRIRSSKSPGTASTYRAARPAAPGVMRPMMSAARRGQPTGARLAVSSVTTALSPGLLEAAERQDLVEEHRR